MTTSFRSPAARTAKEKYTKQCLKKLYGLEKLPAGQLHPAMMCAPDFSAHDYLEEITTVTGKHDRKWWERWWRKNSAQLTWSPKTAKFDVP